MATGQKDVFSIEDSVGDLTRSHLSMSFSKIVVSAGTNSFLVLFQNAHLAYLHFLSYSKDSECFDSFFSKLTNFFETFHVQDIFLQ